MRRVEAVLRTPDLPAFIDLAPSLGIDQFEVTDIRRSPSPSERARQRLYRGQEFTLDLLPRTRVGFVLYENEVHDTIHRLMQQFPVEGISVFKMDEAFVGPDVQPHAVNGNGRSPQAQPHRELN